MAKLFFYYSAMNAGKSTNLLQANYNYLERGMDTLLFAPAIDTRYGLGKISTRIGLSANAVLVDDDFDFYTYIEKAMRDNPNIHCVLVDEAQFISAAQARALAKVADELNMPVLCYGLRTDYMGNLFPASGVLLGIADELRELKTVCFCGKKATMNMLRDENGEKVTSGAQVMIGDKEYISVCRKHFNEGRSTKVPENSTAEAGA